MPRLTMENRTQLKEMYDKGVRTVEMAKALGCSTTAIYDELKRGYDGVDENECPIYNPQKAQKKVNTRVKRCRAL